MIYKGHVLKMSGSHVFSLHCLFKCSSEREKMEEEEWDEKKAGSTLHDLLTPCACLSLAFSKAGCHM